MRTVRRSKQQQQHGYRGCPDPLPPHPPPVAMATDRRHAGTIGDTTTHMIVIDRHGNRQQFTMGHTVRSKHNDDDNENIVNGNQAR